MLITAGLGTVSLVSVLWQPVNGFVSKYIPNVAFIVLVILSGVVFLIFMISALWDLASKLDESENKKPFISVIPEFDINAYLCLGVTNNGEEGIFETQISLLAIEMDGSWTTAPEFSPWVGIWEHSDTNEIPIRKDRTEKVRLAHDREPQGKGLELLGYDLKTKTEEIMQNFSSDVTKIRLKVIITSTPSPRNGTFKKVYEITLSDVAEIKLREFRKNPILHGRPAKRKSILLR
ncbi:MAG: hypothetical protein ABSG90_07935 [Dehalococcoidia bacterium]|jgi:hypothetical protein